MTAEPAKVELRVECEGWRAIDGESLSLQCFEAVDAAEGGLGWPVSILLADDAVMKYLNATYRQKNKPTNVLSFPPGDIPWPDYDYLGDLALGFETCRKEAEARGVSLEDHAAHLIVHGLLHLAGYDHIDDEDAADMEARESAILENMGVANPYSVAADAGEPTHG